MAKKQGLPSILGSTDATLVNAAYKAAMANVPRSLQSVYDTIGRSFEKGMSALGEGFSDLAIAAGDVGAALIEKQKEEDENTQSTQGFNNNTDFSSSSSTTDPTQQTAPGFNANQQHTDGSGNTVDFKINDLDTELEEINKELRSLLPIIGGSELRGEDRKKRRKELREKRDNMFESAKQYEVSSKLISEYLKPENFVVNPERITEANFLRALKNNGKPLADGSRALKGYDDQGNIIFSYRNENGDPIKDAFGNDLTVDANSVKRLIVPANGKINVSFANNQKSSYDSGVQGITLSDYDKTTIAQSTTKEIHTATDFEWAASRQFGGKSLFEDLNSTDLSKTSFRLFSSLNIAAFDSDKSGAVDINDFANNKDNYLKLKSALLNPRDPNFNLGVSKAFLGDFVKDRATVVNKQGLDNYKPPSGNGYYMVQKQSVPKEDIDFTVNLLNSEEDFGPETAWNGTIHKRENGQDFYYDATKGDYVAESRNGIASRIGVMSSRYGYKLAENINNEFATSTGKIELPKELVTSEVNDELFKKFNEIAPGFTFTQLLSETTKQPLKDMYQVKTPDGKFGLDIELDRSIRKESTRKKLENFINAYLQGTLGKEGSGTKIVKK